MKRIILFAIALLLIIFTFVCKTQRQVTNIVRNISQNLRENYNDGHGITIAVIDSGMVIENFDDKNVVNFSEEDTATDSLDHGVPICNIISNEEYGLAPKATIYSLKVMNKYGNSSIVAIVNALEWCLNNSIDIINMSLSFGVYDESIECLIRELIQNNVIIVASISNISKEADYPSMYDGVICVGTTDRPELYDRANSIIFEDSYTVKSICVDGRTKDYVGNSFLAPIVTGTIACLIDKTIEERRGTSEELVEAVKYVLAATNLDIM